LIKELIPPPGYQHQNGFTNEQIFLNLTEKEKLDVEQNLIEMLEKQEDDLFGEKIDWLTCNFAKKIEFDEKSNYENYLGELYQWN